MKTLRELKLSAGRNVIKRFAINNTTSALGLITESGDVIVIDVSSGRRIFQFVGGPTRASAIAWSEAERCFLWGTTDGRILFWDGVGTKSHFKATTARRSQKKRKSFDRHGQPLAPIPTSERAPADRSAVLAISVSRTGKIAAIVQDGTCWVIESGSRHTATARLFCMPVQALWSNQEDLAISYSDGSVQLISGDRAIWIEQPQGSITPQDLAEFVPFVTQDFAVSFPATTARHAFNRTWTTKEIDYITKLSSAEIASTINYDATFARLLGSSLPIGWGRDSTLILGGRHGEVQLVDRATGKPRMVLEQFATTIREVAGSETGVFVTVDVNGVMRLWNYESLSPIHIRQVSNEARDSGLQSIDLAANGTALAVRRDRHSVDILVLDVAATSADASQGSGTVRYTTAKIVLVGDSGAGKTGLGWRLAKGAFAEHSSTHGQQFWVVPSLSQEESSGWHREAVLWDLAGQADYRITHALSLDNVDVAILVMDGASTGEALKGVRYWLNQLRHSEKPAPRTILVGARADRGVPALSNQELAAFCAETHIEGGFVLTSALTGEGLPDLMAKIANLIDWSAQTKTVATASFKQIRNFVLGAKERLTATPLQSIEALFQAALDSGMSVDVEDFEAALFNLAKHGYITLISTVDGLDAVLLAPEVLINLASSIVLEARRNPKGLGAIDEQLILDGRIESRELVALPKDTQDTLLLAAIRLFVSHNLCFRERLGATSLFVFPALINMRRKVTADIERYDAGAWYEISGATENLYAVCVVLLGYTNTFNRAAHWQSEAEYETERGELCSLQSHDSAGGGVVFQLRYSQRTSMPTRTLFQSLVERILLRRNLQVKRFLAPICGGCTESLPREVVSARIRSGKQDSFCTNCGRAMVLPSGDVLDTAESASGAIRIQEKVSHVRTRYEEALSVAKATAQQLHGRLPSVSVFVSYAWGGAMV